MMMTRAVQNYRGQQQKEEEQQMQYEIEAWNNCVEMILVILNQDYEFDR